VLEITLNCCRIGGVVDYRSGTAAKFSISQTNIASRNCEGKSNSNSEERELPASGERKKLRGLKRRRFIRNCVKKLGT
jgi:hypothetical protein